MIDTQNEDSKTLKVNKDTWINVMDTRLKQGFKNIDEVISYMWEHTFGTKSDSPKDKTIKTKSNKK